MFLNKKIVLSVALSILLGASGAWAQNNPENADDFLKQHNIEAPESTPAKEPSQESTPTTQKESAATQDFDIEKSLEEAKAELEDKAILEQKLALARKMHDLRPTRAQVDSAVNKAAASLPPSQKQAFINAMQSMLNYNAIERISVDSMVSTYTLKELDAMVEYYSKPEAMSATSKIRYWAQGVQPEIIRMIDKAMMRIRTGQ